MKIYLNAQFASGKHHDRLLSVGMVSEAGEFYRVLGETEAVQAARRDPWMREHVLSRLPYEEEGRDWFWTPDLCIVTRDELIDDMLGFVDAHPDPEFWGWQASFAYVAVRHLFGRLTDRPNGFPLWCGELAAEWVKAGSPSIPMRAVLGHHALEQAHWAREVDTILHSIPVSE